MILPSSLTVPERVAIAAVAILLTTPAGFAAEGPLLRTGLWATQRISANAADIADLETMAGQNPHLTGIYIHIGWKELEKQSGKFDFNALDRAVDVLRRANRKYVLGIKPGAETPSFVFQEGAQ
jgi:hypothetical protein